MANSHAEKGKKTAKIAIKLKNYNSHNHIHSINEFDCTRSATLVTAISTTAGLMNKCYSSLQLAAPTPQVHN